MTRYYNENPQVTALKELREKDLEYTKKAILLIDKSYRKKLEEFNLLPWWIIMFYKFRY